MSQIENVTNGQVLLGLNVPGDYLASVRLSSEFSVKSLERAISLFPGITYAVYYETGSTVGISGSYSDIRCVINCLSDNAIDFEFLS